MLCFVRWRGARSHEPDGLRLFAGEHGRATATIIAAVVRSSRPQPASLVSTIVDWVTLEAVIPALEAQCPDTLPHLPVSSTNRHIPAQPINKPCITDPDKRGSHGHWRAGPVCAHGVAPTGLDRLSGSRIAARPAFVFPFRRVVSILSEAERMIS